MADDYVKVPEFPTMEMRNAGNEALRKIEEEDGEFSIKDKANYVYMAMLAKRPFVSSSDYFGCDRSECEAPEMCREYNHCMRR